MRRTVWKRRRYLAARDCRCQLSCTTVEGATPRFRAEKEGASSALQFVFEREVLDLVVRLAENSLGIERAVLFRFVALLVCRGDTRSRRETGEGEQ